MTASHACTARGRCQRREVTARCFAALLTLACVYLTSQGFVDHDTQVHTNSRGAPISRRGLLQTSSTPLPTPVPTTEVHQTNTGIAKFRKTFARRDLSGATVEDGWRPDDSKYMEMLASYALFGVAMAILSWLFGILFCMCRGCCNTCGSRNLNPSGYSDKSRLITGCLFLIAGIVIVIGSYWVLAGSSKTSSALNDSFNFMSNSADNIVAEKDRIVQALADVQSTYDNGATSPPSLGDLDRNMADMKASVEDARGAAVTINDPRNYGTLALASLLLILLVLATIAFIIRLATLPMVFAIVGFILLFFFWLIVAITLPLAVFVSDVCVEFSVYLGGSGRGSNVDLLFPCPDVTGGGGLASTIETGLRLAIDDLNPLVPASNRVTFNTNNLDAMQLELDAIGRLSGSTQERDFQLARSLSYLGLQREVELLRDCVFVRNLVADLGNVVCVSMLRALDETWFGSFLVGCALIPAVILAILGNKRWRKQPQTDVEKYGQAGAAGAVGGVGAIVASKQAHLNKDGYDPYSETPTPMPGEYGPYETEMSPLKRNPDIPVPTHHTAGALPPIKPGHAALPGVPALAADGTDPEPEPALPADVSIWTPQHVSLWLHGLGVPQVVPKFTALAVTGKDLLQMTEQDLSAEFGVTDPVVRETIMGPIRDEVKARRAEGLG